MSSPNLVIPIDGWTPVWITTIFSLVLWVLNRVRLLMVRQYGEHLRLLFHKVRRKLFIPGRFSHWLLLILAALPCLVGLFWLGWMAVQITGGGEVTNIDRMVIRTFDTHLTTNQEHFYLFLTQAANKYTTLILGLGVGLYLLASRKVRWLRLWVVTLIGNSLLVGAIKVVVQRPRPVFENPIIMEPNFSFPSGHSAGVLVTYGLLAYLVAKHYESRFPFLSTFTLVATFWLSGMVGVSRVALGVHFPTDVASGWLLGASWLFTCITLDEILNRRPKEHRPMKQSSHSEME